MVICGALQPSSSVKHTINQKVPWEKINFLYFFQPRLPLALHFGICARAFNFFDAGCRVGDLQLVNLVSAALFVLFSLLTLWSLHLKLVAKNLLEKRLKIFTLY